MRVLVIEDNPKMAEAIRKGLAEHGFAVQVCHRGDEGQRESAVNNYDLVILDVMLPDVDGVELCRSMRRRNISTPILMLTALSGTKEKISGLDAGADDYLCKPFDFDELVARVRALLRRGQPSESTVLSYDDLELDLTKRTAIRAGVPIKLSAKEFTLLEYLVRNPERVLSRQTIAEKVWDMNYEPSSNVIEVFVSSLRRKIDRDFGSPLIHTVIRAGYRFGQSQDQPAAASVPAGGI